MTELKQLFAEMTKKRTVIFVNVSRKKDDSKNLKLEDLSPRFVEKESEKAYATKEAVDLGKSYNSKLDSAQDNFTARLKWTAKSIIVEREVEGIKIKMIPFWAN